MRAVNQAYGSDVQGNQGTRDQHIDEQQTSQGQQLKSRRVWGKSRRVPQSNIMNAVPQADGPSCALTAPMELPAPTFCHHCFAKKFAFETKHFCCDDGRVRLATNEWPAELKKLYTS